MKWNLNFWIWPKIFYSKLIPYLLTKNWTYGYLNNIFGQIRWLLLKEQRPRRIAIVVAKSGCGLSKKFLTKFPVI